MNDPASLLRRARRQAGLSQAQLAQRLGMTQAAIAKLERQDSNPTVRTLARALRGTGHELTLGASPWRSGVDESLIRRHLELTPAQRLKGLEDMYAVAMKLRRAGIRSHGG